MATRGETINQYAPTVRVRGSISGDFTLVGADTPFNINTGVDTATVTKVDSGRVIKSDEALVTIVGVCTVTITCQAGTTAHFTINGKSPSARATSRVFSTTTSHCQSTFKATSASDFTIPAGRPSANHNVVLRVRAYKTDANGQYGVSPNEKSPMMLIKFNINE